MSLNVTKGHQMSPKFFFSPASRSSDQIQVNPGKSNQDIFFAVKTPRGPRIASASHGRPVRMTPSSFQPLSGSFSFFQALST
jgi:hypothetical protein